MPDRPATAMTMSMVLEGEKERTRLKVSNWEDHDVTSVWQNWTLRFSQ